MPLPPEARAPCRMPTVTSGSPGQSPPGLCSPLRGHQATLCFQSESRCWFCPLTGPTVLACGPLENPPFSCPHPTVSLLLPPASGPAVASPAGPSLWDRSRLWPTCPHSFWWDLLKCKSYLSCRPLLGASRGPYAWPRRPLFQLDPRVRRRRGRASLGRFISDSHGR